MGGGGRGRGGDHIGKFPTFFEKSREIHFGGRLGARPMGNFPIGKKTKMGNFAMWKNVPNGEVYHLREIENIGILSMLARAPQ